MQTREMGSTHFSTDDLQDTLAARAVRGGAVTVVSQGLKFALSMVATIILARLLSPRDYGLIGMVAVVTGFISMFKDLGLSTAVVQRTQVSHDQVSTLFWINVALSTAVLLLTVTVAPAVVWFYGEPELFWITVLSSGGFLLAGLTVQHEALLRRRMRFSALAVAEIAALVSSIVVAITLAWHGAGYWALVSGQLASAAAYAASMWVACRWRPGRPKRYAGVRPMLAFGGNLTGFGVINYFARNLDNALIGRYWGSQQLGLYGKAYQLLLLPIDQINAPITAVAVPVLSRLVDSPDRYRHAYLRILEKIALLTMPLAAFMIATSDWLVWLVLGPQWMGVSRIFALLGVAAMVQPICGTAGWLFSLSGADERHAPLGARWRNASSSYRFVAGLPWGAVGVATSYSLAFVLVITPLLFSYVCRRGPVRVTDISRVTAPVAIAALGAFVAMLVFRRWADPVHPLGGVAVCLGLTLVITLMLLAAQPGGRRMLRDFGPSLALLMEHRKTVRC